MIDISPVEKTVLGACLLESQADAEFVCSVLRPEHFGLDSHQRIYRHIATLFASQRPVSSVTVMQELAKSREVDAVGGTGYVLDLTSGLPRMLGERLRDYCERIREAWRVRELARLGESLIAEAMDGVSEAATMVQTVTARLEAIVGDAEEEDSRLRASILETMRRFRERRQIRSSPGLRFGIPDLDTLTDGMMPGEQTALGAVSGVGKTALMAQAIYATLMAGYAVDAFLLEPTKDQITWRLMSLAKGIRYEALAKPYKSRQEEAQLAEEAAEFLCDLPLRMFARSGLTLDEVLGQARIGMRKFGTRLICTDYIQRLKIRQTERDEQVRLRVGRASTSLADLVKDTRTHSLLLSQINSGRKGGPNAMPTMFDFRESAQIENDAHQIILLHRVFDEDQGHYTDKGAILVPKQRNGVPGSIEAWFDPITASWTDKGPNAPRDTWHDRSN